MENKISRLFEEQHVNISEVSRKTGIPYGTLYDIARGNTEFAKIKIDQACKIAHEFGMTIDELIGDADIDAGRYEVCQIYDSLDTYGRKALLACAQGLHDAFLEEVSDALASDKYYDDQDA